MTPHGDTGAGRAQLLFADAPKGNGPWRFKTDTGGGTVPEHLKSWEPLGVQPGSVVEFEWTEKHSTSKDGTRTYEDFFVTSAVADGGATLPATPASGGSSPARQPYTPPRHELEKQHRINYWAALSRANEQLGAGAMIEEYQARTGLILADMERYVASELDQADEKTKAEAAEGEPADVPF